MTTLLKRAQQLDSSGKPDLAAQAWRQVLLADPTNPVALKNLSHLHAEAAKAAIDVRPSADGRDPRLLRAQQAAIEGDDQEAFHLYRQVFGNHPPKNWAVPYYQTASSLPSERARAAEALRKLTEDFPGDAELNVEYGRMLTLDPATRLDGARILEKYAATDAEANQILRRALLWDVEDPRIAPEITAYLKISSRDNDELAKAFARAVAGREAAAEEAAAYRALKQGDIAFAAARFCAVLQRQPANAAAMAGRGFVAMRRQDFSAAIHWLNLAKQHGLRQASVRTGIETSRFWLNMQTASTALAAQKADDAEAAVRAALAIKPDNAEATLLLARVFENSGRPAAALTLYRQLAQLTAASPQIDAEAWSGWLKSSATLGQSAGVFAALDQLPADKRDQLHRNFGFLVSLANAYAVAGRSVEAEDTFASAIALAASAATPAQRSGAMLQYAAFCVNEHHYASAEHVYRVMLAQNPANAAAWQGLISAEHLSGNDDEAWKTVRHVPANLQNVLMREASFLTLLAGIQQSRRKFIAARDLLLHAQKVLDDKGGLPSVELLRQLADLDSQLDQPCAAIPLYRAALAGSPKNTGSWTGLLNALHQAGDDKLAAAAQRRMPDLVRVALETNPASSPMYFQTMASVEQSLGDLNATLSWLKKLDALERRSGAKPAIDIELREGWLEYNLHEDQASEATAQRLRNDTQSPVKIGTAQQEQIAELTANLAVRRAAVLTAQGNRHGAVEVLDAATRQVGSDSKARIRLATGYLTAGAPAVSVAIYESLDMRNATVGDMKAAIGAAMETHQKHLAQDWLARALTGNPNDAGLLLLAGEFAESNGNLPLAEKYMRAALAASRGLTPANTDLDANVPVRQRAADLLASIDASYSGWLGVTAYGNHITGTPGTTQLTDVEIPMEASFSIGQRARITALTRTVYVNSGAYLADTTQPLGTLTGTAGAAAVPTAGVGGEVQLATRDFALAVGATPTGFPVTNLTAHALLHVPNNPWKLSFSRDSIRESQLAYAGLHDPGQSANVWGGVVANLATVQYARVNAQSGWYTTSSGGGLTGSHVRTNPQITGDVGAYWQVRAQPTTSLKLGVNFFGQHDARNELFFTYGHGGYFSPEYYLLPVVPLSVTGHHGSRLQYEFAGSLGPQIFLEASAPYFPLDARLQSLRGNPIYPSQSTFGLNYGAQGKAAYLFGDHWRLDAFFSVNNANKYNQQVGGLSLHYLFRDQRAPASHPAGWFPNSGLRPYLVP